MSYIKDDNSTKRKIGMVLTYAVLILFAILAIAPLLWLAINSFKTSQDYQMNRLGLPKRFFWQNYVQAWQRGHFGIFIVNSVIYTFFTTISILVLSFMSGFAFSKIKHPATKGIYGSYVIGILMTLQSIMIPLFIVINQVGLYDTKLGVLIPYIGIGLPMGIYLATEFMKSIPNALVESA
ncbi:MAG TPA: sugar ABC transporter permease, partial [Sphaerochaeta sp.]|nr:sugar ABC transporter permease [Sphaerochaeta sp.]